MMEPEYIEGMKAFDGGKRVTDNPYERGQRQYISWSQGWHKAKYLHDSQELQAQAEEEGLR